MPSGPPETDLVTGAFSYSGASIAESLLAAGHLVRTLTYHPRREHPLRGRVDAGPYRFDDPDALARSLDGVTTLYNTYWVRFERDQTTFAQAIDNSCLLFDAARRAGVSRVVHVSIANPDAESALPYYRGKALVEQALVASGIPHAIVRPTWFFGGSDVLTNNIAWVMRHMPVFVIPGAGDYAVQPVHVDDFVRICLSAAQRDDDVVTDAAGPDRVEYRELIAGVRDAVSRFTPILHAPHRAVGWMSWALGHVLGDVLLTGDEIAGLTAGLLASGDPPLGEISFFDWLHDNASGLGRTYSNELGRHFRGGE